MRKQERIIKNVICNGTIYEVLATAITWLGAEGHTSIEIEKADSIILLTLIRYEDVK
jgi:hypothetical protein